MRYSELTVDDAEEWTALSDSFVPMGHRYRAPHTWWGHLTAQDTAAYTLVRTEQSGDKLASRTLSHTRRGPDDFYWLVFPQRGVFTAVENDTSIRLPPGRGLLMRLDRTWRLHMPASVAYAFRVPRVEIDCRLPPGGRRRRRRWTCDPAWAEWCRPCSAQPMPSMPVSLAASSTPCVIESVSCSA